MLLVGSSLHAEGTPPDIIQPSFPNGIGQQEGRSLSGIVTDATGPIAGASIAIKGSLNGTVSDAEGRFTLNHVKTGDLLQISFIGYVTQEIRYNGQSQLQIHL